MKESKFIEQNRDEWIKFEKLLRSEVKDPDRLSEFFIKITDDLSYARTFYNNRTIRLYLNNICQQLFYLLYKAPKSRAKKTFSIFWKRELPTISYESRYEILASLVIFMLAVCIGVVSSVNDPDFSKIILGDGYISMTIENIESGDPMAVYKKMNEVDMLFGITLNNLLVSIRTFLMGILWAAGSVIILLYNGIMVGTFQYFFIEKGLFTESFLTIWLHGTLEMSAIVIAAASGIVLGKGVIAPGSFSRLQAFQLAAKKGAKLFLGIVPIIVAAAIIESFLTRYTEIPDALRLILIVISLFYMVFYFGWYPRYVVKNGMGMSQKIAGLQASPDFTMSYFGIIKSGGDIMRDTFLFYRKYGSRILRINLTFSIVYLFITIFLIYPTLNIYTYNYGYGDWLIVLVDLFFDYETRPFMMPINAAFFAFYSYFIIRILFQDVNENRKVTRRTTIIFLVYAVLMNLLIYSTGLINLGLQILFGFLFSPLFGLALFVLLQENRTGIRSLYLKTRHLLSKSYGFIYGLSLIVLLISVAGYFFMNSPFPLFYMEFINWNVQLDDEAKNILVISLNSFFSIFTTLITVPIFSIAISMCYFSFKEIREAGELKQRIKAFGK